MDITLPFPFLPFRARLLERRLATPRFAKPGQKLSVITVACDLFSRIAKLDPAGDEIELNEVCVWADFEAVEKVVKSSQNC